MADILISPTTEKNILLKKIRRKKKMYNKICLIEENTIAYSDSGYAILSAGTPVALQSAIKDPETGEDVASIVDSDGNHYKVLEADLLPLDKEEINSLLDSSIPSSCEKHKKIAEKLRPLPYLFLALFGTPLLFLHLFNISIPFLIPSLFYFCVLTSIIAAAEYIKNERKGEYPVSEDYFLNYEENKKKLDKFLEEEKEGEKEEE